MFVQIEPPIENEVAYTSVTKYSKRLLAKYLDLNVKYNLLLGYSASAGHNRQTLTFTDTSVNKKDYQPRSNEDVLQTFLSNKFRTSLETDALISQ